MNQETVAVELMILNKNKLKYRVKFILLHIHLNVER